MGQHSSTSIGTVSCAVVNELFLFPARNNHARVLHALLQEQKVHNAYHMNWPFERLERIRLAIKLEQRVSIRRNCCHSLDRKLTPFIRYWYGNTKITNSFQVWDSVLVNNVTTANFWSNAAVGQKVGSVDFNLQFHEQGQFRPVLFSILKIKK